MSTGLSAFVKNLSMLSPLENSDCQAILSLPVKERRISANDYISREGDTSKTFSVLIDGLAYCQRFAGFDGRQILSLTIPGDALDLSNIFLPTSDHDVRVFVDSRVAEVSSSMLRELAERCPLVARAFHVKSLIDVSVSREWSLNIGRRNARTRIAHLLCEYMVRTKFHGLTIGDVMDFPLTQEQLGDATGLTAVHVNRMLKSLEMDGLIERQKANLIRIPSIGALSGAGEFSSRYLHLPSG